MNNLVARALTASILVCAISFLFLTLPPLAFVGMLGALLVYVLLVEWPQFKLWWLTPLYPILPFLALIDLYISNAEVWTWLVLVVAAYDTGAYMVGTFWGSTPVAPRISPGKTVEGLLGGMIFAACMSVIYLYLLQESLYFGILYHLIAGFLGAILAFYGDLLESYLKRAAGLKDSGSILPGHGGVLDRIDGLLLACLVMDILLYTLG